MSQINYRNFFEACKKGIYFDTDRGSLNVYDLFKLPTDELIKMYKELKQKVVIDDDPILTDVSQDKTALLKYEIVRDILLDRKEEAKKNELMQKKRELENMLAQIRLKQLQENPDEIMKQLEEINAQLNEEIILKSCY